MKGSQHDQAVHILANVNIKQDAEGIQNISRVSLIVLIFIK